jgi:hypothetical protein
MSRDTQVFGLKAVHGLSARPNRPILHAAIVSPQRMIISWRAEFDNE